AKFLTQLLDRPWRHHVDREIIEPGDLTRPPALDLRARNAKPPAVLTCPLQHADHRQNAGDRHRVEAAPLGDAVLCRQLPPMRQQRLRHWPEALDERLHWLTSGTLFSIM